MAQKSLSNWYWSKNPSAPCRYIMAILCKLEIATIVGHYEKKGVNEALGIFVGIPTKNHLEDRWASAHHNKMSWKRCISFDKGNNRILSWGLTRSKHKWEKKITKEKCKNKWQLYWCQTHREKQFDVFLGFCVSGSLFPLNLTVGGCSTTEKYLKAEICWTEMNLSWLAPGTSPRYNVWNRTWTHMHTYA